MLSRRRLLTAGTTAMAGALLLPPPALAAAPDFTTREGWLTWLSANRHRVGLYANTGQTCLTHRADVPQPLASAIKVVHLAAYAESGLDPATTVTVADWERFLLPFTDGGAHFAALRFLGLAADPTTGLAKDPSAEVTLDQLAGVMIYMSDNAATDYLRHRLGEAALRRAGRRGGWPGVDTRSKLADVLYLVAPEEHRPGVPRIPMGERLAHRYLTDEAFRDKVRARVSDPANLPPVDTQLAWARGDARTCATTLATFHRAIATSRFPEAARRHLEFQASTNLPPGVAGIGWKGGSLPGTLTMGVCTRWQDGRVGTAALLLADVPIEDYLAILTNPKSIFGPVTRDLLLDPAWQARVATALGTRPGMLT